MKKYHTLLLLCGSGLAFAQNNIEDAWLYFADKPHAQDFFNQPLSVLNQRALDRRSAQNINLDLTDAPIENTYYTAVQNSQGISIMAKSRWLNAVHVRGLGSDLEALKNLTFVNKLVYAATQLNPAPAPQAPATSKIRQQQKLNLNPGDYTYGQAKSQVELMNVQNLHQAGFTGQGKLIAVLDSGFNTVDSSPCFADLRQRNGIIDGYNFVLHSSDVYTGYPHGTAVLSTILTKLNNETLGTAPNANCLLYITEDATSETILEESYWVEAAERADAMGADILNSSLGYNNFDNATHNHRYQDLNGEVSVASKAASMLLGKGIIATISAGNSGGTNAPYIGAPADAKNIFAVGAVQSDKQLSTFSSIGPSADQRIKPDLVAMGTACTYCKTDGSLSSGNGTSYASPILGGAIASFWSKFPNKSAAEIMQMVKASAHLAQTPNNQYGYGLPNFAIADILATDEITQQNKNPIYPTCFNDVLHLRNEDHKSITLKIYQSNGQLQHQQNKHENINTSHWAKGLYYYHLQLGASQYYGKLIKD